ncbi:hypothetical protein [Thermomonospora umbrina]|uniref:hypothetical protein n=1 Tax=Thermomonospora umbrina TaxID=111806 RepID=UPI0011C11C6E|nr:hypothetical protein [Thermomonospora umbrina]
MCHSDTDPTSPRCTRCNTDLSDVTAQDAPSPHEQRRPLVPEPRAADTQVDPGIRERSIPLAAEPREGAASASGASGGDAGGFREETTSLSPEPWAAQEPNASGFREEVTSLSPEPWATPQPWDHPEPQMWQPPPARRRKNRTGVYALAGLGVWVLAVTALAIVIWPSGEPSPTEGPQQNVTSTQETPVDPTTPASSPSDDGVALSQATRISALLDDMAATRTELGSVVSGGCDISGLERIRDQRQEQLNTARSLEVDALDGGGQVKDALQRALEISVESNNLYIAHSPGCPSDEAADDVNTRASQAKADVILYWNPIASQHGLPSRSSDTI